jgi:hypothetical protein
MNMKTNGSTVWPYVVVGSAIGGAIGYLLVTESGRRLRHTITHPDELADNLEDVRDFVESKARMVSGQVHGVLGKAKHVIEEGERAYHEAGRSFQSGVHKLQNKSGEIEKSVLDPIAELGALYRGFERGIRTVFNSK